MIQYQYPQTSAFSEEMSVHFPDEYEELFIMTSNSFALLNLFFY